MWWQVAYGRTSYAAIDVFEAFKNYDEAGNQRRIQCSKYLVLANMLMESEFNPFDGQEAKPYKNDPKILAMTNLIAAYQRNEIMEFEKILKVSELKGTDVDSSTASAFYNALNVVLWHFG